MHVNAFCGIYTTYSPHSTLNQPCVFKQSIIISISILAIQLSFMQCCVLIINFGRTMLVEGRVSAPSGPRWTKRGRTWSGVCYWFSRPGHDLAHFSLQPMSDSGEACFQVQVRPPRERCSTWSCKMSKRYSTLNHNVMEECCKSFSQKTPWLSYIVYSNPQEPYIRSHGSICM